MDKRAQTLVFSCPQFIQRCMMNYVVKANPSFLVPSNLEETFVAHGVDMAYTGTVRATKSVFGHQFGVLKFWPKANGFEHCNNWATAEFVNRTFRPLAGYDRHVFKQLLSVCCRAILYMLSRTTRSSISIRSSITVTEKLNEANRFIKKSLETKCGTVEIFNRKQDVDGFFNNIGWNKNQGCLFLRMGFMEKAIWWQEWLRRSSKT